MKRPILAVLLSGTCSLGVALAAADSPVGRWKTVDEKSSKITSEVELFEQDGKLFGRIAGLTEPNNREGKPKTCTKCSGADKDKPLVGLVIIQDFSQTGDRYKGGTILDPEEGKVYKAELWMDGGNLKVRGYVGPVFKTQTWVK